MSFITFLNSVLIVVLVVLMPFCNCCNSCLTLLFISTSLLLTVDNISVIVLVIVVLIVVNDRVTPSLIDIKVERKFSFSCSPKVAIV